MSLEQGFGSSRPLPALAIRRRDQRSDSSIQSTRRVSLESRLEENIALEDFLEEQAEQQTLKQTLQRFLSIKSVVSTASSFAQRQQAAVETEAAFREIATGSIGKVFEHPGTPWVYKLPLANDTAKVWNNYVMNRRIEQSFNKLGSAAGEALVPRAIWYAQPSTASFWDVNIDRFEYTDAFPAMRRDVICFERIFPLAKPIRESLIDHFWPENLRDSAKVYEANKDCLVRPLFGRKRRGGHSMLKAFSLRNYQLHLDQYEEIGLEGLGARDLIHAMADALAVLHWHVKIDGNDIEFVLGSSPQGEQQVRREVSLDQLLAAERPRSTFEFVTATDVDFKHRVTSLWLIDFDACSDISMDQQGVNKACKAFCETERYCPRPHSGDPVAQRLWQAFGERYLATAKKFIDNAYQNLPRAFLEAVTSQLKVSDPVRGETSLERGSQRARGRGGRNDGGVDHRGGGSRGGIGSIGRGGHGDGRSRGGRGSAGSRGDTSGGRGFGEESRRGSGSFERRFDQPWR